MSEQNSLTVEDKEMLELIQQVQTSEGKRLRHLRRKIRNRLFRIRQGNEDFDRGLRAFMEEQMTPDMSFEKFTFSWDVSPSNPLKVISVFEWVDEGGTFETLNVLCDDGIMRPQKMCDPTAFTKQE